jgi:CrcB protein
MVIAGAAVGAPLRYLIDRAIHHPAFPWGTLVANVLACAGLGFLTGAAATALPDALRHLLGPGLCATLSTYSTFSWETIRLPAPVAAVNAILSVVAGLAAAYFAGALF